MRSKRGAVRTGDKSDPQQTNPPTLQQRFNGRSGGGKPWAGAGYNDVNPALLLDIISAICSHGDAVIFGRTRDGGALTITILSGAEKMRWYPDSPKAYDYAMREILAAYDVVHEEEDLIIPRAKVG